MPSHRVRVDQHALDDDVVPVAEVGEDVDAHDVDHLDADVEHLLVGDDRNIHALLAFRHDVHEEAQIADLGLLQCFLILVHHPPGLDRAVRERQHAGLEHLWVLLLVRFVAFQCCDFVQVLDDGCLGEIVFVLPDAHNFRAGLVAERLPVDDVWAVHRAALRLVPGRGGVLDVVAYIYIYLSLSLYIYIYIYIYIQATNIHMHIHIHMPISRYMNI